MQHKYVIIDDLPDCYSKSQLKQLVIDSAITNVAVVAVGGGVDWAVYIGFPRFLGDIKPEHREGYSYYVVNVSTPDSVREHGDKLDKETAEKIFPAFPCSVYRH